MCKISLNVRVSSFRRREVVWVLLAILSGSFMPSVSIAQQPTATISTLSGGVLVNDQSQGKGTVLNVGDVIETQVGATLVLELSDGSEIHLGENTQINIDDLAQTATGARVSYIKLLAGWLRAFLSPKHQQEGSSFTIETPNALVGVKFSEPDVEVSYDPAKQETIGIAHTVELLAKNLLTGETKIVPVGSSVIITAVGIKIIAGIVGVVGASSAGSTAASSAGTSSAGMGTGTMVAIGAGAIAAAGGVAAIAASSDDNDTDYFPWAECSQVYTPTNCITPSGCEAHELYTVRAGRSYWIRMSLFPIENTQEVAIDRQPYVSLSVTLNGVALPMDSNTVVEHDPSLGHWEIASYYCTGPLAQCDYTIIGTWYDSRIGNGSSTVPCPLRVR